MMTEDVVLQFQEWLFKKAGAKWQRDILGRIHLVFPPGALLKETTITTYISIIRSYLQQAKNPLSTQEAINYIMQHPNTAVVAALRYFFEMNRQELNIPRNIRRRVAEITQRGLPRSERRHDIITWEEWTKIIDAFPIEGIPREEAKRLPYAGGKFLIHPKYWQYIKAIAIIQMLWGMRAGDVIRTRKIKARITKKDVVLQIEVTKKGEVTPTERPPIYRSVLAQGKKKWMLKYFDWLVSWVYEYKQSSGEDPTEPFLRIRGIREHTLAPKSVMLMYYAGIRYTAEQVLGTRQSTHDIRRSVITTLLNEDNVAVHKVARWVGHRKVDTTMRYYRKDVDINEIFK